MKKILQLATLFALSLCIGAATAQNFQYPPTAITGAGFYPTGDDFITLLTPNGAALSAQSMQYPGPTNTLYGSNPTGVWSGTYVSGITATGTIGQTCLLTSFNDSSTATASIALTGTNTIAAGTPLTMTTPGTGATLAPTSATAGNGTATCSGTATIATVLGVYSPFAVDANGNLIISGGGTTTSALTVNNSGSGAASGATFNGSAPITISYNTLGAQVAGTYVTPTTLNNDSLAASLTTLALGTPLAPANGGTGAEVTGIRYGNTASADTAATGNQINAPNYIAGGGTAQAQTATLSPAIAALVAGQTNFCFLPNAANTSAAPTLAVNGLTATAITKVPNNAALVANDLITTAPACVIYDGTQFELQNPQTAPSGGNYANLCAVVTLSTGATCSGGVISIATGTTSWTISAIPGTGINLEITINDYGTSGAANILAEFNGDTTTGHYDYQQTHGTNTTVTAFSGAAPAVGAVGDSSGMGQAKIIIPFYSKTINKQASSTGGQTSGAVANSDVFTEFWNNNSAITSITFSLGSGNFGTGFATIYETN